MFEVVVTAPVVVKTFLCFHVPKINNCCFAFIHCSTMPLCLSMTSERGSSTNRRKSRESRFDQIRKNQNGFHPIIFIEITEKNGFYVIKIVSRGTTKITK